MSFNLSFKTPLVSKTLRSGVTTTLKKPFQSKNLLEAPTTAKKSQVTISKIPASALKNPPTINIDGSATERKAPLTAKKPSETLLRKNNISAVTPAKGLLAANSTVKNNTYYSAVMPRRGVATPGKQLISGYGNTNNNLNISRTAAVTPGRPLLNNNSNNNNNAQMTKLQPITPKTTTKTATFKAGNGIQGKSVLTPGQQEMTVDMVENQGVTNFANSSNSTDDILMLQARLLQWRFLNAKFSYTFNLQKEDVKRQFYAVTSYISSEHLALYSQEAAMQRKYRQQRLTTWLDVKANPGVQAAEQPFGIFQSNYTEFTRGLAETANKMPIRNAVLKSPDDLSTLLKDSQQTLTKIEELENQTQISAFSGSIQHLTVSINEIAAEFEECQELIKKITELESMERNLLIQQIHLKPK